MCGIIAKLNYASKKPVAASELQKPLRDMLHRGPDDEGVFTDRYCGLAMRRLSIIDVAGGHQPIFNETGDVAVVLNGEIYNYLELRRELEPKHKFKTGTDTEVLVHLYEEYGEEFIGRLNGMFAFALWDSKTETLLAARDRVGVKPLFCCDHNGTLLLSSEIKPLLAFGGVPRDVDRQALVNYLSFYYISSPRTIFERVRRLPQGCFIKARQGKTEIVQYWHYRFNPRKMSEARAAERIREALRSSVRRQLMSEVPLGVFLSSGLDSAAITAMMAGLGVKTRTYTVGYEGGGTYNELEGARLVAKKYGTEHHDCMFGPEQAAEYLPFLTEHLAEPHGDWTYLAMHHVSRRSRKDITVALTGAGGDELFAGYPTLTAAKFGRVYRYLPRPVQEVFRRAADALPVSYERLSLDFKIKSFTRGAAFKPELAHLKYKEILTPGEIKAFMPGSGEADSFEVFAQHLPRVAGDELLDRLMYLDFNVFLPYCSLHAIDMATMLNSQEVRVPLLDNEMLDLAAEIPLGLKIKGLTTKHIVRKALGAYLPEEILKMPKKGFSMPTPFWLRDRLYDFAGDAISSARAGDPGLYDYAFAEKLLSDHRSGRRDNSRKLTCLVSLFIWQRMYR